MTAKATNMFNKTVLAGIFGQSVSVGFGHRVVPRRTLWQRLTRRPPQEPYIEQVGPLVPMKWVVNVFEVHNAEKILIEKDAHLIDYVGLFYPETGPITDWWALDPPITRSEYDTVAFPPGAIRLNLF